MLRLGAAILLYLGLVIAAPAQSFGPVPQVSITTNIPSYAAGSTAVANTGAGNLLCIYGSATKTIYVNVAHATAIATAAIEVPVSIIKYSTAPSGGTGSALTNVPLDSNNAAATATVTAYTVSPTPGTAVGTVGAHIVAVGVQGNTASNTEALWEYGIRADQALVLRGTTQGACINVGAAGAGGSWAVYFKWTEQ